MANVKPTKEIWEEIDRKIHSMYQARIDHASNWANYGLTEEEFERQLIDSAWPETERETCQQLGEKYFVKYASCHISLVGAIEQTGHNVKLPYMMFMPDEFSASYSSNGKRRLATSKPELVAIQGRRRDAIRKLAAERDEFLKKVKELYDAAPSVNALIKLFPPAMDLLSDRVRDRLNKKTERRTVKSLAASVDVSTLSAGMLMAKIGA